MTGFRQNQEARFSMTILILTVGSFITWVPFQCVNVIFIQLSSSMLIPWSTLFLKKLLQLSNSFVNFVVYFLRFPRYRKALSSYVL